MLPSLKKKRLLLPEAGPWLSPAHRQMPAEGALRRLAQDALVLLEFARNGRGFRPQSGRIIFEKGDQRANSDEPADRVKPLWLWKVFRPVWISGTLVEEERHGVLIGRKKLQQRTYPESLGKSFQGIFVPSQCVAVDKDVKTRVIPFHDDVQAGCH